MTDVRCVCAAFAVACLLLSGVVQAQDKELAGTWEDFNHYVLIARPDLAQGLGEQLLNADDEVLLDVVEASSYAETYESTLGRASKLETLKDIAKGLEKKIQSARIKRSREPARIEDDIEKLGQGSRANLNATARLRAAGQYAAPALLAALQDETRKHLHPFILAAMVSSGRPLVYPLAVALPDLEASEQSKIAQVLSEIGYPRSLPYIKEVIENPKTDPSVRIICEAAYRHLAETAGAPENISAAELYLTLGENHYANATAGDPIAGFDPSDEKGMVWNYTPTAGLVATPVPGNVFGYVLTMRATRRALQLNSNMSPALSLWLAANLVRENKLDGEVDPSYPRNKKEASYYLKMAGPLRQHDVLARALKDHDPALALDVIEALTATAGTDALINREGTAQPLLQALSYPDRRVRFRAAFAMTNTRPVDSFPGSHRVVPVLAEAVRQTEDRYAVAIGETEESAQQLGGILREDLGIQTATGRSLGDVLSAVSTGPGVDLIVAQLPLDGIIELQRQRVLDYKFAATPMLALMKNASEVTTLNNLYRDEGNVFPIIVSADAEQLMPAIDQAISDFSGEPIESDEAEMFSLTALDLLHQIGIGHGKVYSASDAEVALIQALGDERDPIVIKSAKVLSLLNSERAQRAIGDAALDLTRPSDLRIELLGSLADSANSFGNLLTDPQVLKVLDLVRTSEDELSQAAARVHGALTLPTENVVPMIAE